MAVRQAAVTRGATMIPLWLASCLVGGLLAFIAFFTWFVSTSFLRPPFHRTKPGGELLTSGRSIHPAWKHVHNPRHDFGFEYEDVEFQGGGKQDHKCRGWLVDRRETAAGKTRSVAVVFVHGGGRDRRAFLRHSSWVCQAGYSALLYDSRGHGVSDGEPGLTFGVQEHLDAIAAVKFMKSRGFKHLVTIGTSIGAVSALLAAHRLPDDVVGVAAENPFTTILDNVEGLVHKVAFERVLLRRNQAAMFMCTPVRRAVTRMTKWRIMQKLGPTAHDPDMQAVNVMAHLAPRPVLLMHGTEDSLIDHSHTVELAKQASSKHTEVWLAEGADHTVLYDKHPEEFRERVFRLLDRATAYAATLDEREAAT